MEITCSEKIKSKMHELTNTEKKIAEYVLNNYEKVLNSNISELAENANVSDASIVRFSRSLGYKGYQDFKINAAKDILPKEQHFNPVLQKEDDNETICSKIFGSKISVLKNTLASLDMDKMVNVAELIAAAGKVVFFGSGSSILVGRDAQHKFLKIGIDTTVYEDVDMQLMVASIMEKGDVAFCISHSGSNYNLVKCLEIASEKGAKTVAIVAQGKTPLSKLADIAIYTASEETIFQSESLSTRIAQLAIIDALIALVAMNDYDTSYNAIQETRKATSHNKF